MGSSDIWVSKRATVSDDWGEPQVVREVNGPTKDSTPRISADGLTLWISSDRDGCVGALDIWRSTRATREDAWSVPVCVTELNSATADSSAAANASLLTLVLTTERPDAVDSDLYWTKRDGLTAPWPTPMLIPNVNTDEDEGGSQLVEGDLKLYFSSSGRSESSDLYVASRSTTEEDFNQIEPISELNTDAEETSPWISEDGRYIVFSSNRHGMLDLYEAFR